MSKISLETIKSSSSGATIFKISGSVDAMTSPELGKQLYKILELNNKIICYLSEIKYISSAGIGALINALNICRKGKGNLVICCLPDTIREAYRKMGLFSMFDYYAERIQAEASF